MKNAVLTLDKWHLPYLAQHLYRGKIDLPRLPVNFLHGTDICGGKYLSKLVDKDTRTPVENFMLDNFYSLAPVPVALGLYKDRKMSKYLEDELNMFCDNGVSFGLYNRDRVIGAGFNIYFEPPSPAQQVGYVCAKDWHNRAAMFAAEQTCQDPVHVWRNYQFLHLQHFNHRVVMETGAKFGLHLSCLSLDEEYRGKDQITTHLIMSLCEQVWAQGGVVTTVANFTQFETHLKKHFPGKVRLIDKVAYSELEFAVKGRRVFEQLEKLDSIRYISICS